MQLENGLQDDQVARRDATTDTGPAPVIALGHRPHVFGQYMDTILYEHLEEYRWHQ